MDLYVNPVPLRQGILVLGSSGTASSVSSGTAETTLASIVIPPRALGTNGRIRITTLWTYTNSGNNKTLRIRYNNATTGTQYLGIANTTTANAQYITYFGANNSTRV